MLVVFFKLMPKFFVIIYHMWIYNIVQLIEFEIYMRIENGVIKDLATYEITVKNIFREYKLNRNRELFYEIILRISFLPSDLTIYYLIIRKVNDR